MTKNEIKQAISIEQIEELLNIFGAEPRIQEDKIISKTICHNSFKDIGNASHKLYYYDNTKLFKCYTDCLETSFDVFDLVKKKMKNEGENWSLPRCISYVASYFGFPFESTEQEESTNLEDWQVIKRYQETLDISNSKLINFSAIENNPIKFFPIVRIPEWEKEGINFETIKKFNIRYNPISGGIIIPHYDLNNNLIGVRERTLVEEKEKYGKYKPAIINGTMYNHPLSFNLYGLNYNKNFIKQCGIAIAFESEKSVLQMDSIAFLSIACCGCNLIPYQVKLLLNLGVKEIVVGFDKQYQNINSEEGKRWIKKLESIKQKYKNYVKISFLHDKWNLLDYKDSPSDKGKDIFEYLFKNRIY